MHNFYRFTARASAATLLHFGLKRLSLKMQEEVFGLYLRLCKDETPLVRRLAAQNLEAWARLLSDAPLRQKELIAAYKNFIHDDQVRLVYWSSSNLFYISELSFIF